MSERTKIGIEVLQVAVIIGILGDVLLRETPWGVNVALFNIAFVGGVLMLFWRHARERLTPQTFALLGAQVFFASMFVWRDAEELLIADALAIITILGILFLPTLKVTARVAGLFQYAVGVIWAGMNSLFGAGTLFGSDIQWNQISSSGWRRTVLSVLRGVMIALPLLLVFGALFMAADAVYEGWVRRVFSVDFENIFGHLVLFGLFGWFSAGYLRGILLAGIPTAAANSPISVNIPKENGGGPSPMARVRAESGEHPVVLAENRTVVEHINIADTSNLEAKNAADAAAEESASEAKLTSKPAWSWANIENSVVPGFTLGTVEIGVIFGLVNLLFLSFVIVQVPYLFGGMELVQNTPDFKLAEYARRGFGELVAVSAIVLPMLLVSHWLIRKDTPAAERLFRALAGVQIVLLFVIMASAVQRLALLTGNLGYGMTTVRLYPLIFMLWLAIVFVLFAATVLRGARQHFAWAALWSAFLILGATHVFNPDDFIVRHNLALMREGREFDAYYNSSLSDDSIPALIESLPDMSLEDRCEVGSAIHYRYRQLGQMVDLRTYSLSRRTAWKLLRANDPLLHQTEGCPEQFSNDKVGYPVPE